QERGLQGANEKTLQAKLARSGDQLRGQKVDGVVWLQENPLLAVSSSSLQTLLDRTVQSVSEYHKTHPLFPGIPKQEILSGLPISKEIISGVLEIAAKKGLIALRQDSVSLPGWIPAASEKEQVLSTKAEASLIQHRLEFPQIDAWAHELGLSQEQARKILYWLVRESRAIKIDDDYFIHSTIWTDLKQKIKSLKETRKTFGVADFKTLFGVSRKYAIPLLERLDREGVTRRAGNERIIL
ncbi:MAG TPA: SelB C-terminal domain-containing protein, partial [Acidobacteriota bacterium]|nr:SelB C-terminal domain-containing protein [Acidobacteriota bacterium]